MAPEKRDIVLLAVGLFAIPLWYIIANYSFPPLFPPVQDNVFEAPIQVSAILLGFSLVVVFYYYEKNNEQKVDMMRISADIIRDFTKDLHEIETALKNTQDSSKKDSQDRGPNQAELTFQQKRRKILEDLQSNSECFDSVSEAIKGFLKSSLELWHGNCQYTSIMLLSMILKSQGCVL